MVCIFDSTQQAEQYISLQCVSLCQFQSMAAATDKKKVSNPSHIHDDIAFSILSKLPLKSLTRFTCAKKSWSLLFLNPHFMNLFRTNFISKHIRVLRIESD